jgi:hypothetical protein
MQFMGAKSRHGYLGKILICKIKLWIISSKNDAEHFIIDPFVGDITKCDFDLSICLSL